MELQNILVAQTLFFSIAYGLECYSCIHYSAPWMTTERASYGPEPYEDCALLDNPPPNLKVNCKFYPPPNSEPSAIQGKHRCGQAAVVMSLALGDGNLVNTSISLSGWVRGCVQVLEGNPSQDFENLIGMMKLAPTLSLSNVWTDAQFCDEDECNSGPFRDPEKCGSGTISKEIKLWIIFIIISAYIIK